VTSEALIVWRNPISTANNYVNEK